MSEETLTTVADLRLQLVKLGYTEEEANAIKGKESLRLAIEGATNSDVFSDMKVEEDIVSEMEAGVPNIGATKWSEYVISLLEPEELAEGHPTVDGLRRIAYTVFPYLDIKIKSVQPPGITNGYIATASCCIVATDELGTKFTFSDISDASPKNTVEPYCKHLSAMAGTRAEGRVLRKLLRLRKVVSAEEIAPEVPEKEEGQVIENDRFEVPDPISNIQILAIDTVCKRYNIDVWKYMNAGKLKYKDVNDITKNVAAEMLEFLHEYEKKDKVVPKTLQPYNPDWRKDDN